METSQKVGNILKNARLARELSIEDMAEKTKISKKLIRNIENNDFSGFPAEIYLIGFLINLGEICKIPDKTILDQYYLDKNENKASGEKGVPPGKIDNASEHKKETPGKLKGLMINRIFLFSVIFILIICLMGIIGYISKGEQRKTIIMSDNKVFKVIEHTMIGEKTSYPLKKGDRVKVFINNKMNLVILNEISGNKNNIELAINNKKISLEQFKNAYVDIDNDQVDDLDIKLKVITDDTAHILITLIHYGSGKVDFQNIWKTQEHIAVGKEYTLFKYQDKFPIEIYIKTTDFPCHLNYISDGQRQNTINLEAGRDTTVTAKEGVEIIIGNYKTVIFILNKIPLNLIQDTTSHSTTKIIKWIPDPENETKFNLIIKSAN